MGGDDIGVILSGRLVQTIFCFLDLDQLLSLVPMRLSNCAISHVNLGVVIMELNQTVMNDQQIAGFTSIGATFADSESTADGAVLSFTKLVCPDGAILPIYELWEVGSKYWKAGYSEAKNIPLTDADGKENNTVTKAFSRFCIRVEKTYGMTKPAKPTGDAPAKAEQRAKAAAELAKQKERPMQDLLAEVQMLTSAPSKATLAKAAKVQSVIDAKRKDELKDRMEGIEALQKEVKALTGSCFEEKVLADVAKILQGFDYSVSG